MITKNFCVCFLDGKDLDIEKLTSLTPFDVEIFRKKGEIIRIGRWKGLSSLETSVRIVSQEVCNRTILLETLFLYHKALKRSGVSEIYIDNVCYMNGNGAVLTVTNNEIKILEQLKTSLLISLYDDE